MKKLILIVLVALLTISLASCGNGAAQPQVFGDTEWTVCWYLCGSDLESKDGAATDDLLEMMAVQLPQNVKIVIQTGGASEWQNDIVSADTLQRYVYDQDGLTLVDEQPSASMGQQDTLADFLAFARKNYPANRTAVILWNHGGGSVSGASFDELYDMDSLDLAEMRGAFAAVFGTNKHQPPVDVIGFDTCLMATVDVANTFCDIGKYLVASQEVEPGNGWLYSGWIGAMAENPTIEPLALSQAICDTYVEGCKIAGTEDEITLSVINLALVENLVDAYDDFGKNALASAVETPAFFTYFSKIARNIENYGGNTREQGFTNMVDLGDLAKEAEDLLPAAAHQVLSALADCVVYRVNGKYCQESTGLSCYYSYNGDLDDLAGYVDMGAGTAFKYFHMYELTGALSAEGMAYLAEMGITTLPELITLNTMGWADAPVVVDEQGCAILDLGREAYDVLATIGFQLYYVDPEEDLMLCLGTDNDMIADWQQGIFKDNFRGVWGSIDGALCYMEMVDEGEDYNCYNVPILLNGEEYNLSVVYDFTSAAYTIGGARKSIDESGAADKNIRYL
ncbi:MAG: clostripain-related cysteine peptidase, partial [Clostridiales bacterium]